MRFMVETTIVSKQGNCFYFCHYKKICINFNNDMRLDRKIPMITISLKARFVFSFE